MLTNGRYTSIFTMPSLAAARTYFTQCVNERMQAGFAPSKALQSEQDNFLFHAAKFGEVAQAYLRQIIQ